MLFHITFVIHHSKSETHWFPKDCIFHSNNLLIITYFVTIPPKINEKLDGLTLSYFWHTCIDILHMHLAMDY